MEKIIYRGYEINIETEPWAINYGFNFNYSLDGEMLIGAETLREAKEAIDNYLAERTQYRVITSKTITKFWDLIEALSFYFKVGGEFKMIVNGVEKNFDAI